MVWLLDCCEWFSVDRKDGNRPSRNFIIDMFCVNPKVASSGMSWLEEPQKWIVHCSIACDFTLRTCLQLNVELHNHMKLSLSDLYSWTKVIWKIQFMLFITTTTLNILPHLMYVCSIQGVALKVLLHLIWIFALKKKSWPFKVFSILTDVNNQITKKIMSSSFLHG